jgi:hypothetical protein
MNPRRFALIVCAAAAVVLPGCAPIAVTTFTEGEEQLAAYRTYAWEAVDTNVPGDPRLDNNPFFHDYVRGAIDRHLVTRGFEPTVVRPDVHVHYHASTRQKLYVAGEGPRTEARGERTVQVYEDGTVIIDLTDARTGALVWRGVADAALAGVVNDQTRMENTIERVVGRLLARLPRRS